jgi:hypothetical protein
MGQLKSVDDDGSWAKMLREVLATAEADRKHLLTDRAQRVVGLQSDSGRLRVLGACALAHPAVAREWRIPASPSNVFFSVISRTGEGRHRHSAGSRYRRGSKRVLGRCTEQKHQYRLSFRYGFDVGNARTCGRLLA